MSAMSGEGSPTESSAGTLWLSYSMNGNLELKDGASIFVASEGEVQFTHVGTLLGARGGIFTLNNSSEITCYGKILRIPDPAVPGRYVPVNVKTTLLNGGTMRVSTNASIWFTGSQHSGENYDLYLDLAKVDLYSGSTLYARLGIRYDNGSELLVTQDPESQEDPEAVTVRGLQNFQASKIRWDTGIYLNLTVEGDLQMYEGSQIIQNYDYTDIAPRFGSLEVTGDFGYEELWHVLNVSGSGFIPVNAITVGGTVSAGDLTTDYPPGWTSFWTEFNELQILPG
jgi:hypothetical protein